MNNKKLFILFSALLITLLLMPTCNSEQNPTDTNEEDSKPEEHPKLSSKLNKLVQAEWRGEAEEFARQGGIELLYDDAGLVSVKVVIECLDGQVEAATKAAEAYGTVGIIYRTSIQVVVPITSLSALADEESVGFVRLPISSV